MIRFLLIFFIVLSVGAGPVMAQNKFFITPGQKEEKAPAESEKPAKRSIFINPFAKDKGQKQGIKPYVDSPKIIVKQPSVVFKPFEYDLKSNPVLAGYDPEAARKAGRDPKIELAQIFETAEKRQGNLAALNRIQAQKAKEFAAREAARLKKIQAEERKKASSPPASGEKTIKPKQVYKGKGQTVPAPSSVFQGYR